MKYAWLTDIHLNFLDDEQRHKFYNSIKLLNVDGLFISGDIAESSSFVAVIQELIEITGNVVYFVLGNHDYYHGTVESVRSIAIKNTKNNEMFNWLPCMDAIELASETFLVGQDGWADGRLGNYVDSRVVINDSRFITDLFQQRIISRMKLLEKMQELADADARALNDDLEKVVMMNAKKVVIITHVPPFKEACLHEGNISDDDWLPFFTSKAMGDVLIRCAEENKNIQFLVLCGHTHSISYYKPLPNITVRSGASEYYKPCVSDIIEIL